VAIKLITKNKIDIEHFKNEVNIMIKIENDNSINIFEQYNSKNEFAIVMELCDCNLEKKLDETSNGFGVVEIKNILKQLNKTFKNMVDNKIMHRDIKLKNILVKNEKDKNFIVKLCDFGISKKLETLSNTNFIGTIETMAPEIIKGEHYDNKCDLWSLGVIIYKLCFKQYPYNGLNTYAIMKQIEQKKQNYFKQTNDEQLNDLIRKLLKPEPEERLTWDQYFNHPFFK
jgi:serine/threonine protein kinase